MTRDEHLRRRYKRHRGLVPVRVALTFANEAPMLTAERTTTGWVTKLGALVEPVR